MAQKAQLLDLCEQGQVEILRFAGTLTEDERRTSGSPDHWEARDLLAHMAFWRLHSAERIAAAREGKIEEEPEKGFQHTNETIFEQFRGADWETIADLVDRSHQALVGLVQLLNDEEINIPGYYPSRGNAPLWQGIAGNAFSHPMAHIGPAYLERGEREYCDEMRLREERLVTALDNSAEWRAVCRYNLGCHWALRGESRKALELIASSLRDRPDLIDWSTQDSDLVSLHGTPEFVAMLEKARKEQETR